MLEIAKYLLYLGNYKFPMTIENCLAIYRGIVAISEHAQKPIIKYCKLWFLTNQNTLLEFRDISERKASFRMSVLKNHAKTFAIAACHQSIGNHRFPSVLENAKHLSTYYWWFLTHRNSTLSMIGGF